MDETWDERATGSAYKRPNFPIEFKRRLVEQSYEAGASVALIARSNDINTNLLFKWRRHRNGSLRRRRFCRWISSQRR
ncbi:transposase [Paraburkholderia mimosarum]|uniref:transposase n=1 Tax=Paraburkholderia mimosarum TaxID=312026 RepID=UPI001FC7D378|nr:transposase [Paraburkholderia mimosarum]